MSSEPTIRPPRECLRSASNEFNLERRAIEARMQTDALTAVRQLRDTGPHAVHRSGVCLFDESWHQGVVGLVASRVKDRVRRPVIAFAIASDDQLRGSARSVSGIHIRDVLDAIAAREPELISKFGGHAMAAGLTVRAFECSTRFAKAFDEEVARWAERGARSRCRRDGRRALGAGDSARNRASAPRRRPVGSVIPRAVFRRRVRPFAIPASWATVT